MNNNKTFQLNTVYTNDVLCYNYGKLATNGASFYSSLYKDRLNECPWPKAHQLYKEFANAHSHCLTYYVPTKRTKCFLHIRVNNSYIAKAKIRLDDYGNEYILLENGKFALHPYDNQDISVEDMKVAFESALKTRQHQYDYIDKLAHLEEYGYCYVEELTKQSSARKIETIDELDKYFN